MSVTGLALTAKSADFQCLEAPDLKGWQQWRAQRVDRIKRAAIALLHRSQGGEALLLRMYLVGEEATECALMDEWSQHAPPWLQQQIAQHLSDEQHHAKAFAQALRERGHAVAQERGQTEPDRLSQAKITRWKKLSLRYAPSFKQGLLVPAYVTGLCAEQMAQRVLSRHCAVIGAQHRMYPLLARVLNDEKRHVQLCQETLQKLVTVEEIPALKKLLAEVRAIDASFGICSAVAMYAAGIYYRVFSAANTVQKTA